jgi:crotonobetainyl-CoA:carnitine CoA-transferase CaiB-like acyl-CoA transferase
MKDLDGITVIALEQAVAAPYASGRLAEAGARVIKIEREEGDFARNYDDFVKGQSAYFVWLNAGKESVTLNLKSSVDAELLEHMLATADVFIQNLAPGALARLGFDPEELHRRYPGLIICSISGYGEDGPYRTQKAYDLLIQAETGLCSVTGIGEELTRVGVSVSDISAGMNAHQEILQALFARERDPDRQGRLINVSLFHATADWMNVPYLQHHYGGFSPQNSGLRHPSIAPYGAFTCSDGKQILLSIQNEREWARLCETVLGDAALASDPRFASNTDRLQHRAELETLMTEIFQRDDREAVIRKLIDADIAYGRVSQLEDLAHHPQNRYRIVDSPNGEIKALGRGAEVQRQPAGNEENMNKPLRVPGIGQDNEKIRQEFGKPA